MISEKEHIAAIDKAYKAIIELLELRGWVMDVRPIKGTPAWFVSPYDGSVHKFEFALEEELKHSRDQEFEVLSKI